MRPWPRVILFPRPKRHNHSVFHCQSSQPRLNRPLDIKFLARGDNAADMAVWRRQLPGQDGVWGNCRFIFERDARDYDWLVVYDDLPPDSGQRFSSRVEELACPPQHTLFITAEPSTIKTYGTDFLAQFGVVLSSQEPWATPHPRVIHAQPGLRWFYGVPYSWVAHPERIRDWQDLHDHPPLHKSRQISTMCSGKRMKHTRHHQRYTFTQRLADEIGELDIYGHGVRPVDDKAEALDPYRYHIAIENHICEHHFTEKLSDAFLGCTLPFYSGCPNAADYFPADSFIAIDIHDRAGSGEIIRAALAGNEYEKRLPAILEARRRVLHEYNLFATIARLVSEHHDANASVLPGSRILSRRALRGQGARHLLRYLRDQWRNKRMNRRYSRD